MKNDYFDPEKAMEAAIDKRKFLITRLNTGRGGTSPPSISDC